MTRSNTSLNWTSSAGKASSAHRVVVIMGLLCLAVVAVAQQPGSDSKPGITRLPATEDGTTATLEDLAVNQAKVADKYAHLEQLLIRMADLEATSNPQRAALLKRAAQQSTDRLTRQQLNMLSKLLTPPSQLKRAIDDQQRVITDLKSLLELLQSENRSDRIKSERERIKEYVAEVNRLIRRQAEVQGRTEGGGDDAKLAEEQGQVADRTGQLDKKIEENEDGGRTPPGSDSNNEKSQDRNKSKNNKSAPGSDSSKNGESKSGDSKEENAKGSGAKDSDAKSGDAKNTDRKGKDAKGVESKNGGSKDKDAKGGDPKESDSKDGDAKGGDPKDGDAKGGEAKSGAAKGGAAKNKKGDPNASGAKKPTRDEEKSAPNQDANEKEQGKDKESDAQEGKSEGKQSPGGKKSANSKSQKAPGKSKGEKGNESTEEPDPDADDAPEDAEQPPEQQNPVRKRLQAARDRMQEAQKRLAEAKRGDAVGDQQKAREELEAAKAELERILRQLREEEIERTLALLEGRFKRMLDAQMLIYERTKRLDQIPVDQRSRDVDILSSKLGFDEGKLVVEAEKALLVLREEGSSVAFPETVEMVRDDMQQVADRLAQTKVDRVTQGIQDDIIQSLEEMVVALKRAQQELQEKRKPNSKKPKSKQQMDPSERPLVDKIAELKMIRSLQVRVNTRTQRFSRLLEDVDDPIGRANDADLRLSISKLAELEQRVFDITRNIVLGKNE